MEIIKDSDDLKIGLYNLEPHIVNSAMMQVSSYHKSRNDDIYIYIAHCFMSLMTESMLSLSLISLQKSMLDLI